MKYISLFSCAGVGCYGFTQEGFECVATNEIDGNRLEIQKINKKCTTESGYIQGDIRDIKTQQRIFAEIDKQESKEIDVLIATPPCQGMSNLNMKKNDTDKKRNSLVVEALILIQNIKPKVFVFENVRSFLKTICTDTDGVDKKIGDAFDAQLSQLYLIESRVLNFMEYGSNSSRIRTLVIGVRRDLTHQMLPNDLFPQRKQTKTLRDVIGHLPSLNVMGEIHDLDIYHFFRKYPPHMRNWISVLKENESAFDNLDASQRPHQIKDGKLVFNKRNMKDKYKRQVWDSPMYCIHTRSDNLASQNTIHPTDDRVFSIRELMLLMTIPESFSWCSNSLSYLNDLSYTDKIKYLRKEEMTIRNVIGEAVPTAIFREIALAIKNCI